MTIRLKLTTLLFLLFLLLQLSAGAQVVDTAAVRKDTSLPVVEKIPVSVQKSLTEENIYLNSKAQPVTMAIRPRKVMGEDGYFYLLLGITLLFGIVKAAYSRYFANLFRVFFNSSLRQSQLTDQLVQDQLPSLIFNLLFVLCGGLYLYFLIRFYGLIPSSTDWKLMGLCVLLFGAVYFVKYITLKFTGWITGYKQEADIYTFIIFLINKIIGICLLPVVIVLAFSEMQVASVFVMISAILVGVLLLMRFYRSYGLLEARIKVSRFHFFLYIFSVEILPLFIIYKAAVLFLNKNW
ncbi:DUF4271 domain-containing protein [Ferruginibacter sp. HRS2-29]|uniref:DUF4271 domain-containing protein n=1 Tax=Ferruginibacter sp. HRS2-29 TaxID=2487334 RepID=UPI0020CF0DB4|nr:DUF4271 domain-containing protein [Ferruginibacter sp. HRS2-29]MCP9751729.1 DUF4271 domain-containing protein [Ferruginibacter sp. HRS2-29]